MSSTTDSRLAMIGAAIDELAEASRAASRAPSGPSASGTPGASGPPGPGSPGSTPDDPGPSGTLAERVARIWAMVADLDPGLAQRLSGYTGQDPQNLRDPHHPGPATHD